MKTLFLERGRKGEREGKKHQCVVASCTSPTGDLARNPGTCPDWESYQQPFGPQASTQSTEPHQPGPFNSLFPFLPLPYWLAKPPVQSEPHCTTGCGDNKHLCCAPFSQGELPVSPEVSAACLSGLLQLSKEVSPFCSQFTELSLWTDLEFSLSATAERMCSLSLSR